MAKKLVDPSEAHIYKVQFKNYYYLHYFYRNFDGKNHARSRYLKKFIREGYQLIFIKNATKEEFKNYVKLFWEDPKCLNKWCFEQSTKNKKGIKKVWSEKAKNNSLIAARKREKDKKQKFIEAKQKGIVYFSNKRIFTSFEEFYSFLPEFALQKNIKTINFNSNIIKNKCKAFYNEETYLTVKKLESLLTFSSCNCLHINFWKERGWSENESILKISEIQRSNAKKVKPSSSRTTSQLNYWLKKGYSIKDAYIKRSERQNTCSYVSKASSTLFLPFYIKYKDKYKCYIHNKIDKHSHEFGIWDKELNKLHCYDFTILDLKLIFEYQGLHVHPRKETLGNNWDKWKHAFTGESADEVQNKYNRKLNIAIQSGFKVIQLWSNDSNLEDIIKKEIDLAISLN